MLQFTLTSSALSAALADLNKVINTRASILVLLNIHVTMDETGRITLTAMYDANSLTMRKHLQADRFRGAGAFLANAAQLTNALKGLPEQDITLECDGVAIRIKYNGGSLAFAADTEIEKFPTPAPRAQAYATTFVEGKTLIDGIKRTRFCTANDDVRKVMTGVYLEKQGERLTFAATDGRTLKYIDIDDKSQSPDYSGIIPPKLCDILRTSIKEGNNVRVAFSEDSRYIYVDYGSTEIDAALIEGRYPNYRNVVPKDCPIHIEVDKKSLISCVKRVAMFASCSTLIRLRYENGQLEITGKDNDMFGRCMTETIAVKKAWADDGSDMEGFKIGLSATLFLNVLSNFDAEQIELRLIDDSHPVTFAGDSATTLLMPMKLEGYEDKPATDEEEVEEQGNEEDEGIDLDDPEVRERVEQVLAERNAAVA